jgi:hypothetical protein
LTDFFGRFDSDDFELVCALFFPPLVKGFFDSLFVAALLDLRHDSGDGVKNADAYNCQNHQVMDWLNFLQKSSNIRDRGLIHILNIY